MAKTIAGVVRTPADAQRLIEELERDCLCDRADISVMARDAAGLGGGIDRGAAAAKSVLDALFEGADTVARALPAGGVFRALGRIGHTLADTGVGTAAEVAKALLALGVPASQARYAGEAFAGGGILVTVSAKTERIAQCAQQTMTKHGALAPEDRVSA
jgi:hypothetical protein